MARRIAIRLVEPAFGLRELGAPLIHHFPRGFGRSAGRIHRRRLCLRRGHHRVVLFARHLILIHQSPVAYDVGLRLGVVGFNLAQARFGGSQVALGGRHRRGGIGYVGLGSGNGGLAGSFGDRNVGILRLNGRFSLRQVGPGLLHGDLEIARVDFHQQLSALHELIFFRVHRGDRALNAGAHAHQVRLHLGVIGGFVGLRIPPEEESAGRQNGSHDQHRDEGLVAAGGAFRLDVGRQRLSIVFSAATAYGLPKNCLMLWSAWPMARARLALARLCANRAAM